MKFYRGWKAIFLGLGIALISGCGAAPSISDRYLKARQLLEAGKWQEADEAIFKAALKVAHRDSEGWFDAESIEKFPCADLSYIDLLYRKYSNGKFGLVPQKEVYLNTGNKIGEYNPETFNKFASAVGWRQNDRWIQYDQLNYSIGEAPQGHLPPTGQPNTGLRAPFKTRKGNPEKYYTYPVLMKRVETCISW
ncbi:MAG: GUN4 domain-containing protein [Cyanobacteriota bacterium]|nr:GUN4 domain-containing protein [Cyanobacteriota bacterium]